MKYKIIKDTSNGFEYYHVLSREEGFIFWILDDWEHICNNFKTKTEAKEYIKKIKIN